MKRQAQLGHLGAG